VDISSNSKFQAKCGFFKLSGDHFPAYSAKSKIAAMAPTNIYKDKRLAVQWRRGLHILGQFQPECIGPGVWEYIYPETEVFG
jgi:hypothetical protein